MNIASAKNKGYYKIKGAASAFDFDFRDKVVLDIGSSTGGFTEYALEQGAKKVIAVEKGTNQMKSPLRGDPRVELHEKTDIFEVRATDSPSEPRIQTSSFEGLRSAAARAEAPAAHGDGPAGRGPRKNLVCIPYPDVIVADVSFVPLTKVLAYAKLKLARSNTDFLVMLKPQFETTDQRDLNRGVVKNESIRRKIIKNFELWLKTHGFIVIKKRDNALAGRHGNVERFYHLRLAK
ncbi:MAG: SAM-dependent methyltransferase [Candidatus Saccharibacteria bacterium]|nr:SAM-dependent methyltransferase [Candidatus Saccharibacteria bacterium]